MPKVVTAIGGLVASVNPVTVAAAAEAVKEFIDKVEHSGVVYKGEHANGHIQGAVREAATRLKGVLTPIQAKPLDPLAGEFARVMIGVMDNIIAMNYDNNPWLRGEWQVSLQGISRAASLALYALKLPKPAPPALVAAVVY